MTTPKTTAASARITRLQAHIAEAQRRLRREQRKHHRRAEAVRRRRLLAYGELVAQAHLETETCEVLLGLLLTGAAQVQDPTTRQTWQTLGTQVLAADPRLQRTLHQLQENAQTPPESVWDEDKGQETSLTSCSNILDAAKLRQ